MRIRKGVINITDNTKKMQTVQVEGLAHEVADAVERYQPFGLTTHLVDCPADGKGAECIIADLGSSSMRTVIVADDRRYRPTAAGQQGDVLLYGIHDTPAATNVDATQRISLCTGDDAIYRIIAKCGNTAITQASDDSIRITNDHFSLTIYSGGNILIFNDAGSIGMAVNGTVNITGPAININGNVNITGDLAVSGAVTNAGTNISKTHTHGGVTTGAGTTGVVS